MDACTEERFLSDVTDHKMEIIRDDGVNRHLKFRKPGTGCYGFDLVTWPWKLCVTGDCGTFVFARLEDMFRFFRSDVKLKEPKKLFINTGYWEEKVLSADRHGGTQMFSERIFKEAVKRSFDLHFEDAEDGDKKARCWDEIEDRVLCCSNEYEAYDAIGSFEHEGFTFVDFFEYNTKEYTFKFLWCLYAIAWGIEQYDGKNSLSRKVAESAKD